MDYELRKVTRNPLSKEEKLRAFRIKERNCPGHCLHAILNWKKSHHPYKQRLDRCCHCGLYFHRELKSPHEYGYHGKFAAKSDYEWRKISLNSDGMTQQQPYLDKVEMVDGYGLDDILIDKSKRRNRKVD